MRYLTFGSTNPATYEVCFLVPQLNKEEMLRHYVRPHLEDHQETLLAYDLFKDGKKTKVAAMREYLADLLPVLVDLEVKYLVVADAEYFKLLTKSPKADSKYGYVLDVSPEFGSFKAVFCPNYRAVFYDPEKTQARISQALTAVKNHLSDVYDDPGIDIIHFAAYPDTLDQIQDWLQRLLDMDVDLGIDIEAFSLKHYDAGIGTISFAWTKHEGIAFAVDYQSIPGATAAPYGKAVRNEPVRALLKEFFKLYLRKALWHNISFDAYILIYQLFMNDLLDTAGLLEGLDIMLRNFDDTKLITYLATNSCAGNKPGLKEQAQEFAGDYAVDSITDITKIPLDQLLQYNLVDSLSTWFVHEKHWDRMVQDDQLTIYTELFKPAVTDIIQMQLTGLPLDRERTLQVQAILQVIVDEAVARMQTNPSVQAYVQFQTHRAWEKDFESRKEKAKNPGKILPKDRATFPDVPFNPNSGPQLQELLFDENFLELPVLETTPTKAPATGGDILSSLLNHTKSASTKELLEALIEYKAIDKILTSFLPNFLAAPQAPDGHHYLYGYFNLGGTVSGRLSSSEPNLQNLPANVFMVLSPELTQRFSAELGPYIKKGKLALGKLIKSCFKAPPGWLFCGLDFASLEDRISALTTKDPNKLKVYVGHITFSVVINGEVHHIRDDTTVSYRGQKFTGKQFYDYCEADSALRKKILDPL